MARKKSEKLNISPEELKLAEAIERKTEVLKSIRVNVKAKNERQKTYWKHLRDSNKQIVIGSGSPGSGKSYMSLSWALKSLKDVECDNVVIIVPTIQSGGEELSIGYLKGDVLMKTQPFQDADMFTLEKILKQGGTTDPRWTVENLVKEGYIKWELVNFILGKTFDNSLILVNEAEQYTKENMRAILTRMGENSRFVISGDEKQVNRKSILKKHEECGLTFITNAFKEFEEVAHVAFSDEDIVRNPFITKILKVFDKNEDNL